MFALLLLAADPMSNPAADARCAALFKGHYDTLPAAWGGEKIKTLSVMTYYAGKLAAATDAAHAKAMVADATAALGKAPPATRKALAETCAAEMGAFGETVGL